MPELLNVENVTEMGLSADSTNRLLQYDFDPGCLRPWIGDDGRSYIALNQKGTKEKKVIVVNATATLRKDEWIAVDLAIVKEAQKRRRLVAAILGAGLRHTIPNGFGKSVFQTETQSDISDAVLNMDGMTEGNSDIPLSEPTFMPMPIAHKDFFFGARALQTSRNGGSPLDTTTAELASRKVSEILEKLTLGSLSSSTYGGGNVYGLANFPSRLSATLTAPTAGGWTGKTLVDEILAMRNQRTAAMHYGPWMLFTAPNWDTYLDQDYSTAKGDNTLRDRLNKIEDVSGVMRLDFMSDFDIFMVQMTSDVIRMVDAMPLTTLQWDTQGGMKLNFKVMQILVPQLRATQDGNTGIIEGSV